MSDPKRLRLLAESGDRQAAAELLRLARHNADRDDTLLAATVLDDVDVLTDLAETALNQRDFKTLGHITGLLGVDPGKDVAGFASSLDALLQEGNGRARNRRLSRQALLRTLADAVRAPSRFAWRHAGDNASGTTTYALGVVTRHAERGDTLVLAATRGAAKHPSPGKAVTALQPWGRDLEANLERVRRWADEPGGTFRLRLRLSQRPVFAAAAADDGGLDAALAPWATELTARPSRAAFDTLLRKLRETPPGDAVVEQLDAWLDASWPTHERAIARRTLGQVGRDPDAPRWRLVRRVELPRSRSVPGDDELAALLTPNGPLAHVERLTWGVDAPALLARVLDSGALPRLTWLELVRPALAEAAWDAVCATSAWPRLTSLTVEPEPRQHPVVAQRRLEHAIRQAGPLPVLRLRALYIDRDTAALLADAVHEARVEHLIMCGEGSHHFPVDAIAEGRGGDQLRTLVLPNGIVRDKTVLRLADSDHLSHLETLVVARQPAMTGRSVVALVASKKLAALRHLDATRSVRAAEELADLVDMAGLARFETLRLRTTCNPADVVDLLRGSRYLQVDPDSLVSEQGLELPD